MSDQRILIAGIGNIFFGDDAFGCEVVRDLLRLRGLPSGVTAVDFGIRSYDLAYALLDDYQAVILVDATQRGQPPGTVYLIEPDFAHLPPESDLVNGHSLNPVLVLQMVKSMGGEPKRLYLVGCEPATLEPEDGTLGLSEIVRAALPEAVQMIDRLIAQLMTEAASCTNSAL